MICCRGRQRFQVEENVRPPGDCVTDTRRATNEPAVEVRQGCDNKCDESKDTYTTKCWSRVYMRWIKELRSRLVNELNGRMLGALGVGHGAAHPHQPTLTCV